MAKLERRKFIRIDGSFVVSYSEVMADNPQTDISQTRNISEGGLLFTTDRQFQKDTILKVRLRLPDYPEYINIKVQVVESREVAGKGFLYDTRAQFINIKEEIKAVIRRIVERKLNGEL